MAKSKSEDLLNKCKAVAVLITALAGLVLGVLNWFKEETKAKLALAQAKTGYAELSRQVEGLSKDVQHLAQSTKLIQDQVTALQNWVLYSSRRQPTQPGQTEVRILRAIKPQQPVALPAPRKPANWDMLQQRKAD